MGKLSQIFQNLPRNLEQAKHLAVNYGTIALIKLYWRYGYDHDGHNAELLSRYLVTVNVEASQDTKIFATFLRDQVIQNSQGTLTTDGIFVIPNAKIVPPAEVPAQ